MSVEMDPPQPKTITHMHPEPVSEVFLTNGTILRQTHYGTTPRESSPFMDSFGSDSPVKVRKISGSANVDARKISENSMAEKLAGKIDSSNKSNDLDYVDTPYVPEGSAQTDQTDDPSTHHVTGVDIEGTSPRSKSHKVSSWIKIDKVGVVTDTGGGPNAGANDESDRSDNESLTVECNDDTGELTDNQSLAGDDDSNFPESECQSEIETAEEEDDDESIRLGQSAIDFESKKTDAVSNVSSSNIVSSSYSKSPKIGKNNKAKLESPAFTEFPKINEERIERIEYLTPKEVKAMQVARRRRNEWESRIKSVKDKKQQEKDHLKSLQRARPLPFTDNHFDSKGSTLPLGTKEKAGDTTPKVEKKNQPLSKQNPDTKPQKSQESPVLITKKRTKEKEPSEGKQMKNPLLKRLVRNALESSSEENPDIKKGKQLPVRQVNRKNQVPLSNFEPVKPDVDNASNVIEKQEEDVASTTVEMKTPTKPAAIPKTAKSEMKSQTFNATFNRQKRMGHRRMKSAPLRIRKEDETNVPSELTPESPFIFISPVPAKDEVRTRSQSVGNKSSKYARGQKELSQLAERVVHEDRLDAERDVPEVLQVSFSDLNLRLVKRE